MKYICLLLLLMLVTACTDIDDKLTEEGVSIQLAQFRKANYKDVTYNLRFSIPEDKQQDIPAGLVVQLALEKPVPVIFDFTGTTVDKLTVNNKPVKYLMKNQHIIIPAKNVSASVNTIEITFTAGNQSLNRRDDFVYTLLVPDRARTLFPCFDQPNLKASFELTLEVPDTWKAVSNGSILSAENKPDGTKTIHFGATEPLSTYLFSFVTGVFDRVDGEKDGRKISLYHRETDRDKVAQCNDILEEVFHSLDWMEDYTGIGYPFAKYDLIILPGFQYGGMEHTGATLYNNRRMFLEKNATAADSLNRSSLIAHETAHMWFGDYVTMEWFNDVWNKEVFANWFASQITAPMYPYIDRELDFITSYYPSAYSEDRTLGAMPIQQPLDNLRNAGLIYSNIVYDKSPVVMEMLIRKIGRENFREAIRRYLKKYAYGNSNWDKLVAILSEKAGEDIIAWSDTWVKEKGMPSITFERKGNQISITQTDPWEMGRVWPMDFSFDTYSSQSGYQTYTAQINGNGTAPLIPVGENERYILPNSTGYGYGYFKSDPVSTQWMLENWGEIPAVSLRLATLMNLFEGVMRRDIGHDEFIRSMIRYLDKEPNQQLFRQAINYTEQVTRLFTGQDDELRRKTEAHLLQIADNHASQTYRIWAMKSFYRLASSKTSLDHLYRIWENAPANTEHRLGESDFIEISYTLAIYYPHKANAIIRTQLSRITNPDKRKEYEFVAQALAPEEQQRQAFFDQLLQPQSWIVEPWAQTALKWLNHPARYPQSLGYIRPALDVLQEVQRESDIFFPANWCSAIFWGHTSSEARNIVEQFFVDNPAYPELLESKIRLRAGHLF